MKRRMLTITIIATALALGAPMAAQAVDYPASLSRTVNIQPGGVYLYVSPSSDNNLPVGTSVSGSLSGEYGDMGAIVTASTRGPVDSVVAQDGSVTFRVTMPSEAVIGSVYNFDVAADAFSEQVLLTIVGVPAVDAEDVYPAAGGLLAFTGGDITPFIWFGGGLLALGAAFVAMMRMVRRGRKSAAGI